MNSTTTERRIKLFSGRAHPLLAESISKELGVPLGEVMLKTFSNGEVYCRFEESVRDADVYLVQPTFGNPLTGVSTNDALMELMLMIDAAVAASAHRVIAVTPWYGYSRQDKQSLPREPISARTVARMLESAGLDRLLTTDLHAGQLQGMFKIPVDHTTALKVLARHFLDGLYTPDELVVVSPDAGRMKLSKCFADLLGAPIAVLDKERPKHQEARVGRLIGDVSNKVAIILDDIVDTAGTLRVAARAVADAGARTIMAAATHPLLSGDAFANISDSPLEALVVTDSVPVSSDVPPIVVVSSIAPMLAESIDQVFSGGSVSEVFGREHQLF